jgi:hypothetical protein
MKKIAENIWFLPFPLKVFGVDIRRNVTLIRLDSGKLVIHSTADFSENDVKAIRELGDPGWLVEGMIDHDTFSDAGHSAFPGIPLLAPEGFSERVKFDVGSLRQPPAEWLPEVEVIQIEGAPKMAESVLFHHPSGTLVVCDLLFHFPEIKSVWAKALLLPTLGWNPAPGFSKRLKMAITDREAFRKSLETVMELPIQRIVPGHGVILEKNAKEKAREVFKKAGLLM